MENQIQHETGKRWRNPAAARPGNLWTSERRHCGGRVAGVMLVLCGTILSGSGQVVLNEIMADNQSAVGNGGEFPDYVELHNPAGQSVSVAGMSLTDDPTKPRQFVFPAGTSIQARGHLVVWCDSSFGSSGLHSGFGLGAKGDRVQLYAADGTTLLDEVSFGLQLPNMSVGRIPSGSGGWVLTQPTARQANLVQTVGEPAQLRINEWMARPLTGEDWIEVYNLAGLPVALGGTILTDSTVTPVSNRPVPPLSFIGARGYRQFFASDLARADADHLDFKLGAGGETLTLFAADRLTVIDRVTFGSQGDDISQGRAPDGSESIATFAAGRATPGEANFVTITSVVISEILTHTDPPLEDAIELQNLSSSPADVSHWWLSDTADQPKKYRIPNGTVIPAGGFKVFYQNQFGAGANGFSLNSSQGDEVYLSAGDASGNLTGAQLFVEFGATKNGISLGRHATSAGVDFVAMSVRTFGADTPSTLAQFRQGTGRTNAAPRVGPIVIMELMFHPADSEEDEFIELHNPGSSPVLLYHPLFPTNRWRLRGGVSFDFPADRTMAAGAYLLLVNFDPVAEPATLAAFRSKFSVPSPVEILGPYAGSLGNAAGMIELLWPDETQGPDKPDAGFTPYELVERIHYSTSAPWPTGASGSGQSLQRETALGYANEPLNWAVAAPSAGRANSVPSDLDSDHDGMPDVWELAHHLNPNSGADAPEDADGDGASNLAEYQAGTDPTRSDSVLQIRGIAAEAGGIYLNFWAVAGRSYQIQFRTGLDPGAWQIVANVDEVAATGELETFVVPPAGPSGFFRVMLE
jgi:hypothetical protein